MDFLLLLEFYKINIPIKTHGYIKTKVATISNTSYTFYGKHQSDKVFIILTTLFNIIKNTI